LQQTKDALRAAKVPGVRLGGANEQSLLNRDEARRRAGELLLVMLEKPACRRTKLRTN
jgi:hypothetical protein